METGKVLLRDDKMAARKKDASRSICDLETEYSSQDGEHSRCGVRKSDYECRYEIMRLN